MTTIHHLKGDKALPPEKVAELRHSYKETILKKYTKEIHHHPINSLEEFITPPLASQSVSMTKELNINLDAEDVAYLASNLPSEQLRKGIHTAEIEQGIARLWAKDDDVIYWQAFKKACQLALDSQRARRPKVEGRFSVRAVKESHDIVDVVSRYTNLRKAGKEYMGKCPFHDDRQPSLEVNQDKQLFYCFSCQRKGDVVNFIMQIEDLDTKQACLLLGT